jgi:hypothetical protein
MLKDSAKPIMVAVLTKAGMSTADVKNWTFTAAGKQVSMEGGLSADGLRELLGLVQSPIPTATVAGTAPTKANAGSQAPASPAEASQRYYKSVDLCIRSLQQSESTAMTGMGLRNAAKRIQQLPILGVDPALVEWGALVSTKLSQANGVLSVGQVEITARAAGVSDPEYSNDANSIRANYAAQRNANNQRRQAASEQRAQSMRDALAILNEAAGTSQKVRAEMVEKYKVEF